MYESFYQLSRKPFRLSPDPDFFYGSRAHRRAMSYLRYGLSKGEGFIIITGMVGTGKTTLVKNLFAELDTQKLVAAQLTNTQLNPDELVGAVCAAFGLAIDGLSKADLLSRLEEFLVNTHSSGKRALLVVDEAQNLPLQALEELRMLSNFQRQEISLLQSFILGQAEFRDILVVPELEQLRQRVIASYHLEPFDESETKHYVEHRLRKAGWQSSPQIEESAFRHIHEWSEGVPRRINVLFDRVLLFGYLEETQVISADTIAKVAQELTDEMPVSKEGLNSPSKAPIKSVQAVHARVTHQGQKGQITDLQTEIVGRKLRGTMTFELIIDSIEDE